MGWAGLPEWSRPWSWLAAVQKRQNRVTVPWLRRLTRWAAYWSGWCPLNGEPPTRCSCDGPVLPAVTHPIPAPVSASGTASGSGDIPCNWQSIHLFACLCFCVSRSPASSPYEQYGTTLASNRSKWDIRSYLKRFSFSFYHTEIKWDKVNWQLWTSPWQMLPHRVQLYRINGGHLPEGWGRIW